MVHLNKRKRISNIEKLNSSNWPLQSGTEEARERSTNLFDEQWINSKQSNKRQEGWNKFIVKKLSIVVYKREWTISYVTMVIDSVECWVDSLKYLHWSLVVISSHFLLFFNCNLPLAEDRRQKKSVTFLEIVASLFSPDAMSNETPLKKFTFAEVAGHNDKNSNFLVIHDMVYDVTKFLDEVIFSLLYPNRDFPLI